MSLKVLTVDDGRVVRMMVARALKPYDCVVFEATNGKEGLETAGRQRPDLILLDVTMPEMDGLEMLSRLRTDVGLKAVPVIMLTAESSQENIAKADQLGISGYVPKPFKEIQLIEKVKMAVPLTELSPPL